MALPEGSLTVDRLASRLGIATEVRAGGGGSVVAGLVLHAAARWCPNLRRPCSEHWRWLSERHKSAGSSHPRSVQVHTMDVQTQGEGPRWTLHQVGL